ncbi:MAG TPA: hypothetical protein VMV91_04735 [Rhodocyclaceae bacterium]|nr:hypothetical protein [Rhodocyclaceae bacterium]
MSSRPETGADDRDLPPAVAGLLQEAADAHAQANRAEAILWSAQAMYPRCLPVYFALYKFYFYRGRLPDAERAVRLALYAAASQGGFAAEWSRATPATTDWSDTRGPQHFYLFSLKALAFICLRRGRRADCVAILEKLAEIDPSDSVGVTVIRDLAAATAGLVPRAVIAR